MKSNPNGLLTNFGPSPTFVHVLRFMLRPLFWVPVWLSLVSIARSQPQIWSHQILNLAGQFSTTSPCVTMGLLTRAGLPFRIGKVECYLATVTASSSMTATSGKNRDPGRSLHPGARHGSSGDNLGRRRELFRPARAQR